MPDVSLLGPVDPASVPDAETEKTAPWIVRKLAGSMTGRIVMSSYESLRAAGTSVVCLSPWGDSSPLLLPCIRFRDLAVHAVIAGTGGMAAVAAPVMGPVSDAIFDSFGDTILVEIGLHTGFELTTKAANDLVIEHSIKHILPSHSGRLETTGVKTLLITLKYKHTVEDANLGFYRSSVHKDPSLFASVKDYLAVEKGWFSPYLFASGRRPVIPRSMKPDVIFCHGPFLSGDYKIGDTLLRESAMVIALCAPPLPEPTKPDPEQDTHPSTLAPPPEQTGHHFPPLSIPSLSKYLAHARSRTPSPEPQLAAVPAPPTPRRLVLLVLGLRPHRKLWTMSARPGESVLSYVLLNGCPAVVLPAQRGAPLLAWDTLPLAELHKLELPDDGVGGAAAGRFGGVADVLFEYVSLCVDWDRVVLQNDAQVGAEVEQSSDNFVKSDEEKKAAVKDALTLLLVAAVQSRDSKEAKKEMDTDRAGIVIYRIP